MSQLEVKCDVAAKKVNRDLDRCHIGMVEGGGTRSGNSQEERNVFYRCLLYSVVTALMRAGGASSLALRG